MSSRLCTHSFWDEITSLAKQKSGKTSVAVAYFGKGAADLLPLTAGSRLVVDMSLKAVKSGQTHPNDVKKLVNKGVDVRSIGKLHAKVFAFPGRAIVGSSNVSRTSAKKLIEAAISTSDGDVVAACHAFVQELGGQPLTPHYCRQMQKLWKPPKGGLGGPTSRDTSSKSVRVANKERVWLVPGVLGSRDKDDKQANSAAKPKAKKRIKSTRLYMVDDFKWEGSGFADQVKRHDLVYVCLKRNGSYFLDPPARVLLTHKYKVGRQRRALVYLEAPKGIRSRRLDVVLEHLGPIAKPLKPMAKGQSARIIHTEQIVSRLPDCWSRLAGIIE
ncbi:MAG TPA: phospholipase D family protein [Tepidisphaeraceae bacterium]|jgi:hypothetical protein|nr:phospholipase D family protein [Tepidisphaeraceae bacterium]